MIHERQTLVPQLTPAMVKNLIRISQLDSLGIRRVIGCGFSTIKRMKTGSKPVFSRACGASRSNTATIKAEERLLIAAAEKMSDSEIMANSKESKIPTVKWMSPALIESLA